MSEAERAEALAIMQRMDARLDELSLGLRDIQRSMTMIELRIGIAIAQLDLLDIRLDQIDRHLDERGLPDAP